MCEREIRGREVIEAVSGSQSRRVAVLVKPGRAKASEAAHVQWVSDGNCTFTADQNADVHNAYGACRNP